MNFPIVIKTPGHQRPNANLYYEVAENGLFQVRNTALYRAVTRVEGPLPGLLPDYERLQLDFPPLPTRLLQEVVAFFAEAYQRYEGEAVVILFYRTDTREHRVGVPPQTLSGRRSFDGKWRAHHALHYGNVTRPTSFLRLGTIHSHADLPAYSSAVDCADEQFEDGLHVVFGDFHRRELSRCASFVVNGVRFPLRADDVLEPVSFPKRPARPEWMKRIRLESTTRYGSWSNGGAREETQKQE
jgi:hypothetical protein